MAAGEEITAREAIIPEALSEPIPDLSAVRAEKDGYRDWPIDKKTPYYREELVDIAEKGLAGQAYYSRYNQTIGHPVGGVPKAIHVRLTLADKLAQINHYLQDPLFASFFGGPVELYVEDGWRSSELQRQLYEKTFPSLIRSQNPEISGEVLREKLKDLISPPSSQDRPSPHATGGAADVILRYRKGTKDHVGSSVVLMGYEEGETSERTYPDYYELHEPRSLEEQLAQKHRRAFYAIMTGAVFAVDTELQVNPTEFWHWSYGDQMWAKLRHQPAALYGAADP